MITLADLTPRRDPVAYARARLDTQGVLLRRIWSHRSTMAFWLCWLALIAAFVALALIVRDHYYLPGDRHVTFSVQELYRYHWATPLFRHVNQLGEFDVIAGVLLVTFVLLLVRGFRFEALILAGGGALHYVQLAIRHAITRPDEQFLAMRANFDGFFAPRIYPGPDGFPSGHVFGEVVVYGLIIAYAGRAIPFKPLAWLVQLACAAEIALGAPARMYTGAHWFSDCIGGALLAGIYLMLAWRIDGIVRHIRGVGSSGGMNHDEREGVLGVVARNPGQLPPNRT